MKRSTASTGAESHTGCRPKPDEVGALLYAVDRRLRTRYGTASLGNLTDPLDELIYIQLSIRTRERAYTDVFEQLRTLVEGDWERLLHLHDDRVLAALQGGGMAAIKLERLRGQLRSITRRFGEATLAPLDQLSNDEAEKFLLSLPGVGPKAARCVLLYSLQREVFPVDSHCLRIMRRLMLISPEIHRKSAHDVLQDLVPKSIRGSLHVNMVHHGRNLCRPRNPDCAACPLLELCPTGHDIQKGEA